MNTVYKSMNIRQKVITFACSSFSLLRSSGAFVFSPYKFAWRDSVQNYPHTSFQYRHRASSHRHLMSSSKNLSEDVTVLTLPYEDHSHNSVKIALLESVDIYKNMTVDQFQERLHATILSCKQLGKSSIWIDVSMANGRFLEAMNGIQNMEFHHANGKIASLSLWLKDNVENKIPEYATHQIGVGAIAINSKDEILCVRELRNNYRPWKIPGGLSELGENIDAAAVREVKEETGIDCRFKSILAFRHTHGLQFGRSDLYFVCRLEPIEDEGIPEPVAQENEIAAVAWVPLQEYKDMVNGENGHPMMQKIMELHDQDWRLNDIQRTVVNSIVPGRKPSPIYHIPSKR